MKAEETPLTVKVEGGVLRIVVGIDTLKFAAEHSPDDRLCWGADGELVCLPVVNEKIFAADVAATMEEEVCVGGDGTSYLHAFMDDAMVRAIEYGSEGVGEKPVLVKDWFRGER